VRRLALTAGAVALVASSLAAASPAGAAASTSRSDDFESGTLHAWSSTASASAQPSAALHGSYGARISAVNAPGYLRWSGAAIQNGHHYATFRAYVDVISHAAGQSVNIVTIKNSNMVNNFDMFVSGSTGRFRWDLRNADSHQSSFVVQTGRWYLIEVQCSFAGSTYNANVRIDGVNQSSIASTGQVSATVRDIWVGAATRRTHVQYYDDVAVAVGDASLGYLGGV
jgi:hypothetical protein